MFGLEGIADQQAVSTFCLFSQISLPASLFISVSLLGSASPPPPPGSSPPISYILYLTIAFLSLSSFTSSPSLHAHPPRRHFHPHYSLPQPEPRQAGRLPGWGPRWCSGESASSGSLSLQDGRTALLWPIWPRPVLAPVCDYGPAGGEARLALGKNRASTQQTGGTNSPTL